MLLGVASERSYLTISEGWTKGIGMIVLLLMVASAVAIFISCRLKSSSFDYLEREIFKTEYGVLAIVKERQEEYKSTYSRYTILGVLLCILSAIPLL